MQKSDAYRRFEEYLYAQLEGAAGGEPVEISPICDHHVRARFETSIWARADIVKTTAPGAAPVGPVVADEAAARAALAEAGAAAARHPALTSRLKPRLSTGEGPDFADMQGAWRESPLPQTRSVVRKCAACAGAGGFACDACEARGDRLCQRCDGAGKVDQVCPACRGRAKSSGARSIWDESILSFRSKPSENEADPDCEACGGAGALKVECAVCEGAKRVTCALCEGSGRVECADCDGTGAETDRYSPTLLFQYACYTAAEPPLEPAAEAKFRRGAQMLFKLGLMRPRFFDFQSDALGHRAVYVAEAPFVGARVSIGRRSPRVMAELYAIGDGPTLIDPPPIVDALHQRALDGLRIAGADGPRRLADALGERDLGRAALRAAARREFAFDASDFEPLATQTYARRLFELAKVCHRFVGWRARRWYWPAAALAAPLMVAGLDATGVTSAFAGWTSVAAASGGFEASAAQNAAAEGGAFVARFATIALWWVLALAGATALYRLTVRRVLGVGRKASRWDALRAGPAPLLGLLAGAGLTALFVAAPTPDPDLVARAGQVAAGVEARREEAQGRAAARAAADPNGWRLYRGRDGVLFARAAALGPREASISIRCYEGRPLLRYEEVAPYLARGARISIGLSTNRRALGVDRARVVEDGVVEWGVDRLTLDSLRSGSWVRVEVLDGAMRWPIREFGLEGSAEAIDRAIEPCPI